MSNIKSGRLVKKDIGDHLMSLLETDRIDQREKILKQEVTDLQSKADRLKKRRDNLRKDLIRNINTNKNDSKGHVHQPIKLSSYLQSDGPSNSQSSRERDAAEVLDAYRRSQIMQAYAICHGVTAKSTTTNSDFALGRHDQHARLASYQFHPVSESNGKIHGPFDIVLANKPGEQDSIVLFSYNFPEPGDPSFKPASKPVLVSDRQRKLNRDETRKPVLPIEELEERYLKKSPSSGNNIEGSSGVIPIENNISLDSFVRSVSDHLSAYVSRMDQVQELLPKNGSSKADCGEVYDVRFSRDIRKVKFVLKLVDSDGTSGSGEVEESNDNLLLKISMDYDGDGRRPKQGCVHIKISGNQKNRYSPEDLESLGSQCEVFYSRTLADGIKAAFVEE